MKDFTLKAYREYLIALKGKDYPFITFHELMSGTLSPECYCIVRHDVDRKPQNALAMAKLEYDLGIRATYYFRTKRHTFNAAIIESIHMMGHEVGYHYECLSDSKGDISIAIADFRSQLARMRELVPVSTISMHGRPLRPFDNRDIWKDAETHALLQKEFDILGEVYLDVDYTDIAYINDTGRNWFSNVSNRRDKVLSNIPADHSSGEDLLHYLKNDPHPKIVFQIHPERWTDNRLEWLQQKLKDQMINLVKSLISKSSA